MPDKWKLKTKYGMSLYDYDYLLKDQENRCAICGERFNDTNKIPQVDHNHKTGVVRGLLCRSCNTKLMLIKDDIQFCESAAYYLRGEFEYRK